MGLINRIEGLAMPAKRRLAKARSLTVSDAARERWQETGGIQVSASGAGIVTDPELAALIGRLPWVSYPDLGPIAEQLRGHCDET